MDEGANVCLLTAVGVTVLPLAPVLWGLGEAMDSIPAVAAAELIGSDEEDNDLGDDASVIVGGLADGVASIGVSVPGLASTLARGVGPRGSRSSSVPTVAPRDGDGVVDGANEEVIGDVDRSEDD